MTRPSTSYEVDDTLPRGSVTDTNWPRSLYAFEVVKSVAPFSTTVDCTCPKASKLVRFSTQLATTAGAFAHATPVDGHWTAAVESVSTCDVTRPCASYPYHVVRSEGTAGDTPAGLSFTVDFETNSRLELYV